MPKKRTADPTLDLDPETTFREVLEIAFGAPPPEGMRQDRETGELYAETIQEEMDLVRQKVAQKAAINMSIVRHLMYWRDSRMWEDARDDSGNEFPTWSEFLKWACKEIGIHKSTYQHGLRGVTIGRQLGVGWNDFSIHAPATIDKALTMMTAENPETGLIEWSPTFVAEAARAQVTPLEYARELLAKAPSEILPAVRTVTKAPQPVAVRAKQTRKGYEISGWQDDLFLGAFVADKDTSPEVIAYLERKLKVTFFQED